VGKSLGQLLVEILEKTKYFAVCRARFISKDWLHLDLLLRVCGVRVNGGGVRFLDDFVQVWQVGLEDAAEVVLQLLC